MPSTAEVAADPGNVTLQLHKRETAGSGYWGHPGICTVTFCEGDPKVVLDAIKPKLRAVLDANPWIAGQFFAKKLVHPPTGSDALVNELLSLQPNPGNVHRAAPYQSLVKAVANNDALAVQNGGKTQKTMARVTKLVLVEPVAPGGEFAIIFSMSHVVADGHDYYKIFNMILGTAPVEKLDAVRVAEYEAREPEWTGPKDFKWLSGGGLIKGMLTGLLCGPKSSWRAYEVDPSLVAAAKEKAPKPPGGFVSTNDVLTSHFLKATRARVCMMVINMRDKISLTITDKNAGCYEGCLLLDQQNASGPEKVRACIAAGVPYTRQEPSPPLPGCCGSCPMSFITSWASFPFEVSIEGVSKQVLHLPCMAMPNVMDVAVVFKPSPGKLGMLYMAKRATPTSLLGPDTVLGKTIDDQLFPTP